MMKSIFKTMCFTFFLIEKTGLAWGEMTKILSTLYKKQPKANSNKSCFAARLLKYKANIQNYNFGLGGEV